MIWRVYSFFYRLAVTTIVLFALLLTLNHAIFVFAQEYLQKNDISYSTIEGSLFNGISVYDLKYKEILRAKSISMRYRFMSLIAFKPLIKTLQAKNLVIYMDKIQQTDNNQSSSSIGIIPFKISDINLENTLLIVNKEAYHFDVKIKKLTFENAFNVKNIDGNFNTPYALGTIEAQVIDNRLYGHFSQLMPSEYTNKNYLNFLAKIPAFSDTTIKVDENKIMLHVNTDKLLFKDVKELAVYKPKVDFEYDLKAQDFKVRTNYDVEYAKNLMSIEQKASFTLQGSYNSQLHVNLLKYPKAIPIKSLDINVSGDTKKLVLDANASDYKLHIHSDDYNKYTASLSNKNINIVQSNTISLQTNATVMVKPLYVKGDFTLADKFANMKGVYAFQDDFLSAQGMVELKKKSNIYEKYHLAELSPLKLDYKRKNSEGILKLNSKILNLFITHKDNLIQAKGSFASAAIQLKSNLNEEYPALHVKTKIASLNKFLNETKLAGKTDTTQYDGVMDVNTTLHFTNELTVQSSVFSPWVSVRTNSQIQYTLNDIAMNTVYKNSKIIIKNYQAEYKKFKLYAKQASEISFDKNNSVVINKFYIYENLILNGNIDPSLGNMKLRLYGENFHIVTDNMNVSAKADIKFDVQNSVSQVVDGNITLIKGVMSYMPPSDYTVSDEDIIIIQDQKLHKASKLALNIHVNAQTPIKYKTKQADIDFLPDVTVFKESKKPIIYSGQISILQGKIFAEDKEFYFVKADENKITLNTQQLNPQLNLVLHYKTLDYKEIFIRITNTLSSPIIIFSSNPVMSQNDIMSYILFGEPASSIFDSSGARKTSLNFLFVGSGLKNIFKQGTGIKIDTLNILNNTDGTYGYEVGAKFTKDIRVIYKNDTASSVVVQYGLSKSIRVDVDVHDAGQGIYLIYMKDIK